MIKTIGIVSLSSGLLGEGFVAHEVKIGLERLDKLGLKVKLLPNAMKGIDYIRNHPEKRAADLLEAFRDPEIDLIMTAIGGDDTYRLLPYLFDSDGLQSCPRKPFLGFSDTTINHLMLNRVGMPSFYGQAFLPDVCELESDMLPYTFRFFRELITTGTIREIVPSDTWYESRSDFGEDRIGTSLQAHPNSGFELLQGSASFSGKILGGCLDTLFDIFDGGRYADMPELCRKYNLFPSAEEWRGRILLLETSEEKMPPEKYRKAVTALKNTGLFKEINGVIAGKPMDEAYDADYRRILIETIGDPDLPVVWNLSVGHALPRAIIPFGIEAAVDAGLQRITFPG